MTKYVLAVSGGVDSVVLLDMFATRKLSTIYYLIPTTYELIIAHFDHGIRPDSAKDAEFVAGLAKKYGLKFETKREELGPNASEELARNRRYKFLRNIAKKYDAKLVTAHHADDVIESIAINLSRGTGWRGLAVLDSDILRPLTDMTKAEILKYAKTNDLKWREDSTNASDKYLRNRIRRQLSNLDDDSKRQLLALWSTQKQSKQLIHHELERIIDDKEVYDRHFYIVTDFAAGLECLRRITNGLLTRPQLMNALIAIKVMPAGKVFDAGNGVEFNFTSRNFTLKLVK